MKPFLVWLSHGLIRLIGWTLRMKVEDRAGVLDHPEHAPVIIAFWHNRTGLMPLLYERYCRGRTALTMISRSRDGQFMADVAARFGIKAVRGSSSRHGMSAMLSAIRASTDPRIDLVITPDGPRGPCYEIQPGVIRLAQVTQRPIVAISYRLEWKYLLKSWDRFQIPLPFSQCYLTTSEPIFVPENASESELGTISAQLKRALEGA